MKHKNISSVIILSASTFGVGVLSYAYHPIMIHYLSLKEFAEFESLIGIINLLGVIVGSIVLFLVKEFAKDNKNKKVFNLINISKKYGFYLSILFYGIFLLLSPLIGRFLNIENLWLINLSGLTIFFSFFVMYQQGFIRGKKYFGFLSFAGILNPIFRISFGFLLVLLGFGVFGAIGGFIISQVLLIIITGLFINKKLKSNKYISKNINSENTEQEIIQDFKSQKKQIGQFFLSSIILALLMNIDILFAKHFFEPEIAGTYAGISIIAKFLVFVGMSIETVYFPVLTAKKYIDKPKIYLLSSLYALMTLGALGFFYLFGEKILYIFKPGFEVYLDLLYLIIIYCGSLALLNFLVKILVAFNKFILNYILIGFLIIGIVLLYICTNNSMYNLIHVFNGIILISIMSNFLYLGFVKNEK